MLTKALVPFHVDVGGSAGLLWTNQGPAASSLQPLQSRDTTQVQLKVANDHRERCSTISLNRRSYFRFFLLEVHIVPPFPVIKY